MSEGRVSDEQAEAFQGDTIRPAVLGYLDFASGPVRFWIPGVHMLTWGGHDWYGVGGLVRIHELEEAIDGRSIPTILELTAIPLTMEFDGASIDILRIALNETWHQRTAILYAGLFETNSLRWVLEPIQIRKRFMDVMDLTEAGTMASISLSIEGEDYDNQRTDRQNYTDTAQQALYPGDRFFAQVASLQDKQIIWNLG